MSTTLRRVVVTGMGIASCLGNDLGTVSSALSDDRRYLLVHVLNLDDAERVVRQIKTRYEAPLMEIFP